MKQKLKDYLDEKTYIFITVQYAQDGRVFFYNGYVKAISSADIIFLDDKSGEIPIDIDLVKSAAPSTKRPENE